MHPAEYHALLSYNFMGNMYIYVMYIYVVTDLKILVSSRVLHQLWPFHPKKTVYFLARLFKMRRNLLVEFMWFMENIFGNMLSE